MIEAISWQGFARFGLGTGGLIVLAGGVAAILWSWVAWHFTGYELSGSQLHIRDGVLSRRQRTIHLERLQTVEVVQPLAARLFGLAELRCEVVGAAKTEAPLAYLTLAQATQLRAALLALSRRLEVREPTETSDVDQSSEEPVATKPAPILRLSTRRLLISQLLTPQVFGVPIAAAVT
ncbi:MAG: PH domain-containing protein, partial [Stackebrandtia sp.]